MSNTETDRNQASKKKTGEPPPVRSPKESMASISHKFLVISSQGGVGKTSVLLNLAVALSKKAVKVGLMDANYHGPEIHRMLGIEAEIAGNSEKCFTPVAYSNGLKVASIGSVMQGSDETGGRGKTLKLSDIRRFTAGVNWGSLECLFVDTPPGPGEGLLTVIRTIPEAKPIIVTAPNKIGRGRAKKMIDFLTKEKISVFGWIENMRGFFCQNCGGRLELFSSGSGSRAVFLGAIPFLGRIPIDPHMAECADAGEPFLEKYPDSEVAEAFNLITEKIMGGNQSSLSEDRSVYCDL